MADCRDLESLFAPYVDGEAAPRDCAALDAHLRNCPVCRDRVAAERVVHEAVAARRGTLRECASAELRRRCEAHCQRSKNREGARVRSGGLSGFSGAFSRKTWVPLSMVATLVLTIAGVFLYGLSGSVEALGTQLAADHVKCFEFASMPTIVPDAKRLGREWADSRGWSITVPESAAVEQLELLDLRRCISSEGQTAHVMYKWRGRPFSVYVLNSEHPRVGAVPRLVERLGQEAMIWSKGGRTYAVVTRGTKAEIEHVAQYVQRAAR
jgi:anti-sigma factor RsiW